MKKLLAALLLIAAPVGQAAAQSCPPNSDPIRDKSGRTSCTARPQTPVMSGGHVTYGSGFPQVSDGNANYNDTQPISTHGKPGQLKVLKTQSDKKLEKFEAEAKKAAEEKAKREAELNGTTPIAPTPQSSEPRRDDTKTMRSDKELLTPTENQ